MVGIVCQLLPLGLQDIYNLHIFGVCFGSTENQTTIGEFCPACALRLLFEALVCTHTLGLLLVLGIVSPQLKGRPTLSEWVWRQQ